MSLQINQYTKTRTKLTSQADDLMDLDSTEDAGSTFESAKIKVSEFIAYVAGQLPPIAMYVIDGTLSSNRTITALTRFTKWVGGNVVVKMADAVNNYGFKVEDNTGAEVGGLGYDQATSSAELELKSSGSTFLNAKDSIIDFNNSMIYGNTVNVGINTDEAEEGAQLEVRSENKGFLKPRLTTTQRDAISRPVAGLEIYNSTTAKMNFYNGDSWEVITSA